MSPFVVIIPARNEAGCIESTLRELRESLADVPHVIAVGINGTTDETAAIAAKWGALVGYAAQRGYGHGCMAAIEAAAHTTPCAYIFCAADGAHDAADVLRLIKEYKTGSKFVLGQRTFCLENWCHGGGSRRVQNLILGFWASVLSGRMFSDLGPLRLIEADLFKAMDLQELEFGWTIEAQLRAVQLQATISTIQVREIERSSGTQKISGVSWRHSLRIGWHIVSAGWRSYLRRSTVTQASAAIATIPSTGMTHHASSHAAMPDASCSP
jgi:glycosyltransferase involved in cell wall biosynthesis